MKNVIISVFCLTILFSCNSEAKFADFQNGDIIFQTSKSNQSKAIQLATKSIYSHMGIIYVQKGEVLVYEAVQPVKLTPLKEWVKRGEKEHFVLKRLRNSKKKLTTDNLKKLKTIGEQYLGKDYDQYFDWSNEKIYCSELVWKIYKEALNIEIGKLEKLSDFNLSNEIVKAKIKERYGDEIPLNELVISPVSMFNSKELIKIYESK